MMRYRQFADQILDELAELPSEQEWRAIARLLGLYQGRNWEIATPESISLALRLLEHASSQRRELWQQLTPEQRVTGWIWAQDLALRSATCLAIAESVGDVSEMAPHQAVRHAAQCSLPAHLSHVPEHLWATEPEPHG